MRLRYLICLALFVGVVVGRGWLHDAPAAQKPVDALSKEAVAFLNKHCVACHGEKVKRADLTLHQFSDDLTFLKGRKTLQSALHMVTTGEMPPKAKSRPTTEEVERFVKSVNAVWENADKNGRPDPGRVTIRRLNRAEYNNTIRDLVGIDFNPAEDFPADDIGHGFDNIGDVLSLSPVLMERYLAAAESIVNRAIVPNAPKPPVRHISSRYTEPATSDQARWRPVKGKGGMLHTPYRITLDGEFVFRFKAYTNSSDKEPVKVAVWVNDKEIKQLDVAADEKKPIVVEVPMTLEVGDRRVFVKLLNPGEGETNRTLFVEYLELSGPSDTRPISQRKLLAVTPNKPKAEQTREVLTRFVSKAYRRPAAKEEIERLVKLVESVEAKGEKWEAGMQLALQAVLVSPKFLFRVELDDRPVSEQPKALDEHQLAARLSYFLWSSMPDEELIDHANKKTLTANLDAQVRRMLKDPKAEELVDNFAMQWLQLRRLASFAPDSKMFPNWNERLRNAMLKETQLFFEEIVREDRSILDLIEADYTYLNETLARHYGIADTKGNWMYQKPTKQGGKPIRGEHFVRVEVPPERGGLLTQASVLTVTSNPTRTSPVKRGRWVLEQILGTPPPPPPPDVPELKDEKVLTGSLRQRMEQHRANVACANCHARMDPIGFAFENYNAIGAYRQKDGDFPIDASGTLPDGKSFKGAGELKQILKDKKELLSRCLTEKLMIYALGRGLEYYDKRTVDKILTALEKDSYKFSRLILEIVKSDPFRLRRGKDDVQ